MAVDPQEIQRRLMQNGLADVHKRIADDRSQLAVAQRDADAAAKRIAEIEADIKDAEGERAAIQGLLGQPVVDPDA